MEKCIFLMLCVAPGGPGIQSPHQLLFAFRRWQPQTDDSEDGVPDSCSDVALFVFVRPTVY